MYYIFYNSHRKKISALLGFTEFAMDVIEFHWTPSDFNEFQWMGKYNTKVEYAKTNTVADQQWYTLSDTNSGVEINKVFRVDFMDSKGVYVKIPRLLENEIPTMDID